MNADILDVVKCKKLRVVVFQIDDVDDDFIEETISETAKALEAKYAVHAVPLDEDKTYVSHVAIDLE